MWARREIENYLPLPDVLVRYFEKKYSENLFTSNYEAEIKSIIEEEVPPAASKDKNHVFWINIKVSDEFIEKMLKKFSKSKNISLPLSKRKYYLLIKYAKKEELNSEIEEKFRKK